MSNDFVSICFDSHKNYEIHNNIYRVSYFNLLSLIILQRGVIAKSKYKSYNILRRPLQKLRRFWIQDPF